MSVMDRLNALAGFGAVVAGRSVTRLAWSKEARAAAEWLMAEMRAVGLRCWMDGAGNVIGAWDAGSGKAVGIGSHYDTTPESGIFDGALGVVGALEAIRILRARGFQPRRPVWVVGFHDEEGSLGVPFLGSRASCGLLQLGELVEKGTVAAIRQAGFNEEEVAGARWIDELQAFVELHVEQGPILDNDQSEIGVVINAVGARTFRLNLRGQANHAGTTPMDMRQDALCAAARTILAVRDYAKVRNATCTVGKLSLRPGASNAIPGDVSLTVDFRSVELDTLNAFEADLTRLVSPISEEERVEFELISTHTHNPVELDAGICDIVESIANRRGLRHRRLASGAGHDCLVLAPYVAVGLVFVPSQKGISHSPDEFTTASQCTLGVEVVAETIERLAT